MIQKREELSSEYGFGLSELGEDPYTYKGVFPFLNMSVCVTITRRCFMVILLSPKSKGEMC